MRQLHLPALAVAALCITVLAAPNAPAAPATQPAAATMPAATRPSYPDWAMKAYPDDIIRLMRFDKLKEAQSTGLRDMAALSGDPAKMPQYIQTIASLCHIYLALNRTDEAEKYAAIAVKALSSVKATGQNKDLEVAHAALEQAQSEIASNRDQPDRAEEFAISALERLEAALQTNNRRLTDLRIVDQALEVEHFKIRAADGTAVPDATPTFNSAIQIYTAQLGVNSAPVADALMSEGYYFLNNTGNIRQALAAFQRALTIRQNIYGENSEVGSSLEALALLDAAGNSSEQALSRLRAARAMTLKVIGEDDPSVAGIDIEIAAVLDRSKGDAAEAERLLLKAAGVFEKYPETQTDLAETLEMLASHYHLQPGDASAAKADAAQTRADEVRARLKKHQDL